MKNINKKTGFIKVKCWKERLYKKETILDWFIKYININYIISVSSDNWHNEIEKNGINTKITLLEGNGVAVYRTDLSVDEVINLIEKAK